MNDLTILAISHTFAATSETSYTVKMAAYRSVGNGTFGMSTPDCELNGILYPVYNEETVECGGCNTVYARPE